jgi:hypothetical protein
MDLKNYFVSKEQSESLKELGFNEDCLAYYRYDGELILKPANAISENGTPLIMQAIDWLANELDSRITSIDDGIDTLKDIRRKIDVTVTLTFEKFFPKNVVYSDGAYLVMIRNNKYPISVDVLYGEFISYDETPFDMDIIEYIAKSFKFTNE